MKITNNHRLYAVTILFLFVFGSAAVYAQKYQAAWAAARPQIKIMLLGAVERNGQNVPVAEAGRVNSGEVLLWKITSANEGGAPALSHDAVAQIPAGTTLVAGSAASEADAVVSYSIDGGKTFSAQPMVAERQADGSVKQVPAPISMYTRIRYHWDSPLAVSRERTASYKVRVN